MKTEVQKSQPGCALGESVFPPFDTEMVHELPEGFAEDPEGG